MDVNYSWIFLNTMKAKIFAKNKKQTKEYRKYFNTLIKIQQNIKNVAEFAQCRRQDVIPETMH